MEKYPKKPAAGRHRKAAQGKAGSGEAYPKIALFLKWGKYDI
jgi:hypothetical protein